MRSRILMFFAIASIGIAGCEKTCDEWFELENGDCVEMREKFYGTYTGIFNSGGGNPTTGYILLSESADGVQRIEMESQSFSIDGSVSTHFLSVTGSNSVDFPTQLQYGPGGPAVNLEGSGSLDGDVITINFTQDANGQTYQFVFTGTK